MKGQQMPKSWHGCSPMYGLFNCTTENTQKKQYQDVEATDWLPGLAEYLTRHSITLTLTTTNSFIMQYNKKPHLDELTVAETITPLRLNVPVASNPLTLSHMRKTVPQGHNAFRQLHYHPWD